jgi:hypothetical protein
MGRKAIFRDDRDREHFVELLSEMVGRYGIVLHACVLMDNHYHLLIETPAANASRALQWLYIGRMRCGLTLKELGAQAGGLGVPAVAKVIEKTAARLKTGKALAHVRIKVVVKCLMSNYDPNKPVKCLMSNYDPNKPSSTSWSCCLRWSGVTGSCYTPAC